MPDGQDVPKQALLLETILISEACEKFTQQEAALAGFNLWYVY